jgi:hypothetical protein
VRDLPDLRPVDRRADRRHLDAGRQVDPLEDLGSRVDERVQHEVLLQTRLGVGRLEPEVAAHPAVDRVEGLAHLVLDGLALEGQRQ